MKKHIILAFLSLFLQSSLYAQRVTHVISYQGIINGVNGVTPKDSTYPVTVILWTEPDGGSPLWQDIFQTEVKGGVFNISLGSQTPLPSSQVMDHSLWISASVGEYSEATLRSSLAAVPMAVNVADSAITTKKVVDQAITTAKLADSSVTADKMNMNYISSISINGNPITGVGRTLNIVSGDGVNATWIPNEGTLLLSGNGGSGGGMKTLSVSYNHVAYFNTLTGVYDAGTASAINVVLHGDPGTPGSSPTWGPVNLGSDVSSVLPIANGGTSNVPKWSPGIGIYPNLATDHNSVVAGGNSNIAENIAATVGGGYLNSAYGDDAVISGGEGNTVGVDSVDPNSFHSAIGGGANNTALGIGTAIPGGNSLMLGSFSFGFNGDQDTAEPAYTELPPHVPPLTNLSDSFGGGNYIGVAYFGNVNIMVGNVDTNAREVQFYSPNPGSRNFSPATVTYSSFRATTQSHNIQYTLPASRPTVGQFLKAQGVTLGSGYAPDAVALSWANPPSDTVIDTSGGGGGGPAGWLLTGNSGTTAGTNFLGTLDNVAMEIHVHDSAATSTGGNKRVMRYYEGTTSPNILGGSSFNTLDPGLTGAAILSGGTMANPNKINLSDTFSLIAGGTGNIIDTLAPFSAILSGQGNHITGDTTLPGYGWHNGFDVIAGGRGNFMGAQISWRSGFNFIGGGDSNFVGYGSYDNVIAGGKKNLLADAYGSIGGGIGNLLNGPGALCVIAGGYYNTVGGDISVNAGPIYASSILGGDSNMIRQYASYSTIVGGSHNTIDSGVMCATIGGGENNTIDTASPTSTISGGSGNFIGGHQLTNFSDVHFPDTIPGLGDVIAGGDSNRILGDYSSVGGGQNNLITPAGDHASIPGGIGLIAAAYAQTVVGAYNQAEIGTLLTVGNGTDSIRSNAFTVSSDGSASAYQSINSGNATSIGTMYANNTIEAWGNVQSGASGDTAIASIGVLSVTFSAADTNYIIQLNVMNPDGSLHTFRSGQASIVATISQGLSGTPGIVSVSQLSTHHSAGYC